MSWAAGGDADVQLADVIGQAIGINQMLKKGARGRAIRRHACAVAAVCRFAQCAFGVDSAELQEVRPQASMRDLEIGAAQ